MLLTLRELSKKYPGGQLPLLDPVADMGIQDEEVRGYACLLDELLGLALLGLDQAVAPQQSLHMHAKFPIVQTD